MSSNLLERILCYFTRKSIIFHVGKEILKEITTIR